MWLKSGFFYNFLLKYFSGRWKKFLAQGRSWNFVTFLSGHEILYCVSYPKPQGQSTSCDAYFMVAMDTGMKAPLLGHKRVPHKCEADQWTEMSWMGKLPGNCGGHTKALLCTTKLEKSPCLCPQAPGVISSDPGSESRPTVGKKEVWGHLLQWGRNQGPQNLHPLHTTDSKGDHIESAHMGSILSASTHSKWGF